MKAITAIVVTDEDGNETKYEGTGFVNVTSSQQKMAFGYAKIVGSSIDVHLVAPVDESVNGA